MSSTMLLIVYKDKYIGTALYSYETLVAAHLDNQLYITTDAYNHSKTTSKHINEFFGLDRKKIENGFALKVDNLDDLITEKKLEVKAKMDAFERATGISAANDNDEVEIKKSNKLKM